VWPCESSREDVIRRRFESGRRNLEAVYERLVDAWVLYDSSGEAPRVALEER
jgi:predicted ABC-type ATPase